MKHPYADLIGLEVDQQNSEGSVCSLRVSEDHFNPHGVVHGALLYSLADTGMGAALYPLLGEGEICATIEIKISYFAPVRSGTVKCVTRVINRGKKVASMESEISADDVLVAKASGSYAVFRPGKR